MNEYQIDAVKFYGGLLVALATFVACIWAVL